jgi:hypothetical protein
LEVTLGAMLHALGVPFLGALMAAVGIGLALVGRLYVPRRGSIALMALVAALLKLLSVAGGVLSPMVAIAAEGVVAELVVMVGGIHRPVFMAAAALAALWSMVHAFLRVWLTGGLDLFQSYLAIATRGAQAIGVSDASPHVVLAILAVIHLFIGATGGALAWRVGQGLRRRGRHWGGDTR